MNPLKSEQALQARSIRERFLVCDARLPDRISPENILVVGFADECEVRQSVAFFALFSKFLRISGEESFFFLWLDAASHDSLHGCSLSQHSVSCDTENTNFVRIQSPVDDDVLAGDAWFVASRSGQWAIYGEQYESELAVFLASDAETARRMLDVFAEVVSDANSVATDLGDPSDTEDGEQFAQRLRTNYSSSL